MRKIIFLFLLMGIVACKSRNISADSAEKFKVENLADVISQNNMEQVYPEANMTEGTDFFEEGTVERPYSILYPNTPDEILVIWADDARSKVHQIRFENNGRWKSATGIKIGTGYAELEKMNGPFKFYGFGWDYSGAVDWNGGKLANSNVRVFLAPTNTPNTKFYGDQIIEASREEIEELNLTVKTILLQMEE